MKTIRQFLLFIVVSLPFVAIAQQTNSDKPLDGFYERVSPMEREVIPYDHIRESDVFWHRRVWRVIDVNEKMNFPFQYNNSDWLDVKPLIVVLMDGLKSGEITGFNEDNFKTKTDFQEASKRGGAGYDTVPKSDPSTGEVIGDTVVYNDFDNSAVKRYRIKEDWFIDEETSTMQCRIIAIAPLYKDEQLGDIPLFWAAYNDLRKVLVKNDVFNPKNDAIRFSWDDLFEARMFSSYIIKESNVFDRKISEYSSGIDALMESERIKSDVFEKEHNMWSF
ncbi:MAG: gliding motility protein GldN [Bacteroidota bacterium]